MSDVFHTETYTHASGKQYHVEWSYDHDHGAPHEDYEGHGEVIELDFDPTDEEEVSNYFDYYFEADDDGVDLLTEQARLSMMRVLRFRHGRHDKLVCYDVMATMTRAREEGWGMSKEWKAKHPDATETDIIMAAINEDFKYLEGWYDDRWHWCTVGVAPLDEDGEPIEEHRAYCGGYESTILDHDQTAHRTEIIEDQIHEVEWALRRELHKDQMELPLFA
jgi:hypothetical protein